MPQPSPSIIAMVIITFFVAGLVKGVTGMGLPTVAMGVLGALTTPLTAASLLLIPSFVTNLWQLLAGPNLRLTTLRVWPMMLTIFAATLAGSFVLANGGTEITTAALGTALIAYAGYALSGRQVRISPRLEKWMSPIIGAVTGIITGCTGVFVIPAVPYLQSLGFEQDDLVQALGLSFTISTIALALGLATHGAFMADNLARSSLAMVPALAGMGAGQYLRARISRATFRRWFLIGLFLLGVEMLSQYLR